MLKVFKYVLSLFRISLDRSFWSVSLRVWWVKHAWKEIMVCLMRHAECLRKPRQELLISL